LFTIDSGALLMRIFLTGASGFVGSFFLQNLLKTRNYNVAVLLRTPESAWRIKEQLPQVQIIQGDLGNPHALESQLIHFQPTAFVHLAWHGVLGKDRNTLMQWRNVPETIELIELASRVGATHWIGLGSQAEYGPCQNRIDENTPTRPTTLYGASKFAACMLGERICQELGIRFAWLRLFSSYGPTDNPAWLIPYLANTLLDGNKPQLTSAEQLWDYIYIEDVASAIRAVLDTYEASGIFNLGSGTATKLRIIIENIRDSIDPKLSLGFGEVPYRPDQVMHLEADITRLTTLTGWLPKTDISSGLRKTIDWYAGAKL
jgi:nucleoside-diphosphate-sugar epimerase